MHCQMHYRITFNVLYYEINKISPSNMITVLYQLLESTNKHPKLKWRCMGRFIGKVQITLK